MSTPIRTSNEVQTLNLLATSSSIELGHNGFLKFHTTIDGVSSGASIKRFFAIGEQGLLLHAENQQLIDMTGGFFNLGLFSSVESTEDSPHFVLTSKTRSVDVFLSAETFEERANWVDALRKAMPKARRKLKNTDRSMSPIPHLKSPTEAGADGSIAMSGLGTLSAKAKKVLSSELTRSSSPKTPTSGPTVVWNAVVKIAEAKPTSGEPDAFLLLDLDAAQYRTRTVLKSNNPLWSEDVTLRFKDPATSALRVSLWDEHGAKENILGKLEVNLSTFVPNVPATMEWYPLSYAANNAYVSGELHVRLDTTQKQLEAGGVISFTVIEGRNLPLRTRGSSETYVRASMGKQSVKSKIHKTAEKTESNQKSIVAEAAWNETLELKTNDGIGEITVSVYKASGIGTSTCIGQIILSPFTLPDCYQGWVPLEVSPEMLDKETSKASGKESVGDVRLSIQVTRTTVYPLEYYDPLISLLMQEDTVANLVGVFELTTLKPEDRVSVAWHLVNIYEAKNRAPAILKALISREIQIAPDVETLFRANSLASKAVDMYMKICGHRYLKYCIQDTIDAIYKDGGKKNLEIDPLKLDKTEDARKNWKNLSKHLDDLLNRILNSVDHCPSGMIQIFAHLQKEVESKFADANVRYTGVSSFLFLRLIVPAILGPKLFDLANDHPPPKVAANLTTLGRVVQRIANMSPMDFAAKEFLREREFYIEKQKRPMQVFIDTLCSSTTSFDFDPAAVDLQQECSFIQAHLESHLSVIIASTTSEEGRAVARSASHLLIALDAMAAKAVKPRKPCMIQVGTDPEEENWVVNPKFDPEQDRFQLDASGGGDDGSGSENGSGKLSTPDKKKKSARRKSAGTHSDGIGRSQSLAVPVEAEKRKSKLERML